MSDIASTAVAPPGRLIFQAMLTPHRSMSRRGMFVVFGLMAVGSLLVTSLMWRLGAVMVIGFNGADLLLAVTLYAMNMRAAKASEAIVLTDEALTITRTTPGGRRSEVRLAPGWLRVEIEEQPGSNPLVWVANREARHIVGLALGDAARRDLAGALREAIQRMRSPRFDNPQTRG
ncbi:MAG TPA: DUF2244 domain-containing protein [Acidiphilium sp.]|jgi:uncharacterized membrane protein|uniref:DUF2244 domain-containing protein n=1 Tax=unclassified Acidiphilium TaxID=2617493 RepID=UPI000BDC8B0D|nr:MULTISPECIES: DUF2244 domain-containing protein [unclassified Acidiphilium]OYV56452.1 MAG: hypothetical protein B7Z76_05980 [Acidiphilium sp. 20-67-58]HQT59866.1 DUF2244 domain-containing protein [Acidiphilium sp.]HQU11016.1 DUF2244 domain-containing protein [Acidiphilium sp.]